jgi:hypothetical protein
MAMDSPPKSPTVPQSDAEDYGGDIALKNGGRSFMRGSSKVTPTPMDRDQFIDIGKPFAIAGQKINKAATAGASKYRQEEAKGFKAPLRSAALGFAEGVAEMGRGMVGSGKPSWKTPPPLTADIGKADVMPNKRTTRN